MGLVTLPNLYCSDADVQDYLSTEGVELRLDDHSQATGQTVQCVTAAAAGATSIPIAALDVPLPNGCVLNFDGAGLSAVAQVTLTALAPVGATSLTVLALSAAIPVGAFALDNGVNIATNARVLKARQYATARVKRYCCSRYQDADLATAFSVNEWATYIAGRWLCKRRGQGVPKSIQDDFEEAMEELKAVHGGKLDIEDISTRTSDWPSFSNVSVDLSYDIHRVRVERSISEPTPTQYAQYQDWWDSQTTEF